MWVCVRLNGTRQLLSCAGKVEGERNQKILIRRSFDSHLVELLCTVFMIIVVVVVYILFPVPVSQQLHAVFSISLDFLCYGNLILIFLLLSCHKNLGAAFVCYNFQQFPLFSKNFCLVFGF